jgi:hypothetical protein
MRFPSFFPASGSSSNRPNERVSPSHGDLQHSRRHAITAHGLIPVPLGFTGCSQEAPDVACVVLLLEVAGPNRP